MSVKSQVKNDLGTKFYHVTFNTVNHQINYQKVIRYFIYLVTFLLFIVIVATLAAINIRYANNGKYNFHDLFLIFSTNNIFSNNTDQINNLTNSTGSTFGSLNFIDLVPIKKATWISIATVIAGIGLAVTGAVIQGITKNPLSDPTTLGTTEAVIFGAILMNVLVGSFVSADIFQYVYLAFGFLGGLLAVGFILIIIRQKSNLDYLKITLSGLAISIFFKTVSFILRSSSKNALKTSFAISIGGAENVYGLYPSQETILYLAILLIAIGTIVSIFIAKNLSILELGDNKAASLGVNTKLVKIISLIIVLILVPTAITLVGNVAFVGLFVPHIIRIIFKTRNYLIIIPLGALLGGLVMNLGLTFNTFFASIPSSIYMVFIGAPMLIYLGWKQKG
ncbi:Iron ABC transporter permease [[Mycoplasma] cavipharyngis]|uniref:FecCD family ABC transporter permease n=1 Tax=[Mycoplasma] cavipharyngis TaxID=92757 RepID=UPI0037038DEC